MIVTSPVVDGGGSDLKSEISEIKFMSFEEKKGDHRLEKVDQILEEAKKHLGTPYLWGGSTTDGFDCSGFVQYVFQKYHIQLPRNSAMMARTTNQDIDLEKLEKGDLVFFTHGFGVQHVGIYTGDGRMVSSRTGGVSIDSIKPRTYWGNRLVSAKRVIQ